MADSRAGFVDLDVYNGIPIRTHGQAQLSCAIGSSANFRSGDSTYLRLGFARQGANSFEPTTDDRPLPEPFKVILQSSQFPDVFRLDFSQLKDEQVRGKTP